MTKGPKLEPVDTGQVYPEAAYTEPGVCGRCGANRDLAYLRVVYDMRAETLRKLPHGEIRDALIQLRENSGEEMLQEEYKACAECMADFVAAGTTKRATAVALCSVLVFLGVDTEGGGDVWGQLTPMWTVIQ